VPVEFLSDQQVARFGRFVGDLSPVDLERFFRLDAGAVQLLRWKRRDENRLGFAVQLGTVRMLGTFLGEDPAAVPAAVAAFVAEQLEIPDPACLRAYAERPKTAYEHQWGPATIRPKPAIAPPRALGGRSTARFLVHREQLDRRGLP
jgi:hypothetical protein